MTDFVRLEKEDNTGEYFSITGKEVAGLFGAKSGYLENNILFYNSNKTIVLDTYILTEYLCESECIRRQYDEYGY